jgi:amino-acid N-acetyltransferase
MVMTIQKATEQDRGAIITLLQSQKLPSGDLPPVLETFFIATEENKLIGAVGLERYGSYGLLRSMVVHPDYRNRQIAEKMVQQVEQTASDSGITVIYLLTQTAEKYFSKRGYALTTRENVPQALFQSSEFSHVCPVSATVMQKDLVQQSITTLL